MNYPDIKLVYWAGGNPFHHHQDINRLRRAFNVPANHRRARKRLDADGEIRRHRAAGHHDAGARRHRRRRYRSKAGRDAQGRRAGRRSARRFRYFCRAVAAHGRRTGLCGRTRQPAVAGPSLRADAARARRRRLRCARLRGILAARRTRAAAGPDDGGLLRAFRNDPDNNRLPTPSGKIEIHSNAIAGFGYDDCPPHPAWLPSTEPTTARHPLTLIANQPATRLHSQLDFGAYSQSRKIAGREPVRLNPADAARRGIADGDIVRLFNDRGACLAGAIVSDDVMAGVVQLSTGAWYDPEHGASGTTALRPRQPERADPRRRHLAAGARLLRPGDGGRVRKISGGAACDPRLRSSRSGLTVRVARGDRIAQIRWRAG